MLRKPSVPRWVRVRVTGSQLEVMAAGPLVARSRPAAAAETGAVRKKEAAVPIKHQFY